MIFPALNVAQVEGRDLGTAKAAAERRYIFRNEGMELGRRPRVPPARQDAPACPHFTRSRLSAYQVSRIAAGYEAAVAEASDRSARWSVASSSARRVVPASTSCDSSSPHSSFKLLNLSIIRFCSAGGGTGISMFFNLVPSTFACPHCFFNCGTIWVSRK